MNNEKQGEKRKTRAAVSGSIFRKNTKVTNKAEQSGVAEVRGSTVGEQGVLVNRALQGGEATLDRVTTQARSNVLNQAVGNNAAAKAKELEVGEEAVVENRAQIQPPSIVSGAQAVPEEEKDRPRCSAAVFMQNVVVGEHATVINQSVVNILPEQKSELPEIWHVPPDNENYFTGRDELLENIHGSFSISKTQSILTLQPAKLKACYGLGGIGKTQLALRYVRQNKKDYAYRLWFLAESSESLMRDYRDFCEVANIPLPPQASDQIIIDKVKKILSKHPKLLLVYDNAENYDAISSYLPTDGNDIDIIITSRHQKGWPNPMPIDLPTQEEAIVLIKKRIGIVDPSQDEEVIELVTLMDRLPLALAQAAAYVKENNISISEYIQQYKSESILLGEHELNKDEYPTSVMLTWVITMKKIAQEQPLALQALYCCAYLAPDNISKTFLEKLITLDHQSSQGVPDEKIGIIVNQVLLNKVRACLCHYSMIQYDLERELVNVHRLVQEVVRKKLESDGASITVIKIVIELLNSQYDYDFLKIEKIEKSESLLSHVVSVLSNLEEIENHFDQEAFLYRRKR